MVNISPTVKICILLLIPPAHLTVSIFMTPILPRTVLIAITQLNQICATKVLMLLNALIASISNTVLVFGILPTLPTVSIVMMSSVVLIYKINPSVSLIDNFLKMNIEKEY